MWVRCMTAPVRMSDASLRIATASGYNPAGRDSKPEIRGCTRPAILPGQASGRGTKAWTNLSFFKLADSYCTKDALEPLLCVQTCTAYRCGGT